MLRRKLQTLLLHLPAKLMANLACALGGLPSLGQLQTQVCQQQRQLESIDAQQKALYRVITKIRASLDLDMIFRTTTKETCKLLRVERVAVYRFFDDWGGEFVEDFEFSEPGWDFGSLGQNVVWNDSYLQQHQGGRYAQNQCLIASDIYTAGLSQCHIEILEQFHIRAYATAPIFIGQQLWGVLAAYQHSQPHVWQPQEIQFLSQVANHLGFAMKQAQLMASTQQKAEDARLASEQQEILSHLIAEIRESLDLNTLFKTTTREVRKALQTDRVGIFQFDPDSNYNHGEFVAENVLPEYDAAMGVQVNDHCFGEQFAVQYHHGRVQVLSDIHQANLQHCHLAILNQFQIKAQVILPLMKGDQLWGLLCVHQCSSPRVWQTSEVVFLKRLAAQFSVALSHAELLSQYRVQTEQLNQALERLQEANQKLEELSNLDPLTQIWNRRFFDKTLAAEWKRLIRPAHSLSLILFDIDYFKHYNDHYGHPAGDACLIQLTDALRSIFKRTTDVLARYGGEEFAVILPNTDQAGAIAIAAQIQAVVKQLGIPHQGIPSATNTLDSCTLDACVTVSLGIASQIPTVDGSVQELVQQADRALYRAKQNGRNCWICSSTLGEEQRSPPTHEPDPTPNLNPEAIAMKVPQPTS